MSNPAVFNSLIHTKIQSRKIPLTVLPYSLIHTKKTGFNTASRKRCQIPLFLTVWFTQRFSPGKSRSVSPHSLIHSKTQSRKIPLSVASQSDSHKSQRRKLDRQPPQPNPHPRPPPLEVGEKLPEWRVTLHLYVWQQVRRETAAHATFSPNIRWTSEYSRGTGKANTSWGHRPNTTSRSKCLRMIHSRKTRSLAIHITPVNHNSDDYSDVFGTNGHTDYGIMTVSNVREYVSDMRVLWDND